MTNESEDLFPASELQELFVTDSGYSGTGTSIAYVGPTLTNGRMDAILLADGLKGVARFVNRVAQMRLKDESLVRLSVQGDPRTGSLEVFVNIFDFLVNGVKEIGNSSFMQGLAIIATLSGFNLKDAGRSLVAMFVKLNGRPITDATNLDDVQFPNLPIDRAEIIRIYNDPEVQAAIRAALRPLRDEGINKFETRQGGQAVEVVTKSDLLSADKAETDAIVTDEKKELDIQKASFVEHLAWHVSDNGHPFDAKIEDPTLWSLVAKGQRFGFGDRLSVNLHTEAERDHNGRLRYSRTITKVHRVDRANGDQLNLFDPPENSPPPSSLVRD